MMPCRETWGPCALVSQHIAVHRQAMHAEAWQQQKQPLEPGRLYTLGSSETCSSIHTAPCKCQARTVQQKQEATGLPMLLSQGTRACEVSTQRHLLEQQQASHEPQTA